MSPASFTIYLNLLSRSLAQVEQDGLISGVKILRQSSKITHVMYVDDIVIYCKATFKETLEVKKCLRHIAHGRDKRLSRLSLLYTLAGMSMASSNVKLLE